MTIIAMEDLTREARRLEQNGAWEQAVTIYQSALEQSSDARLHSELWRKIGIVHYNRGNYEAATPAFTQSERKAAGAGAAQEQALAINCIASLAVASGQLDDAERHFRRAYPLAQLLGNEHLITIIDQNLATLANIRGDSDAALERNLSVIERYDRAGNHAGLCGALNNAGMIHADLEQVEAAEACYQRALEIAIAENDAELIGTIQLNRAELSFKCNRLDDARLYCDQAFGMFGRVENRLGLAEAYKVYGKIYRETGRTELAEAHFNVAARSAEESGYYLLHAESEAELALVYLARGKSQEALQKLNKAHRLFEEVRARRELFDNDKQLDRLEARYFQVVEAWGDSIEANDAYTAGHCGRVARYTAMLAEAVGYSGRELNWIRMGGFLHDVGKTGVDPEILNKPGKLNQDEWLAMQRHTVIGDEIISKLDFPYDIRPIVRNHHERWDGTGYPDQLMGDEIPRTARILCVADVFVALTTTRSFRQAYTREEALRIMHEEAGTVLDPELFRTFTRLLDDEGNNR